MIRIVEFTFLVYLFILIPRAALRSRKLIGDRLAISRERLYANVMISTAILGLISIATAYVTWIDLFPRRAITARHVLIGAIALVVRLAVALARIRTGAIRSNRAVILLAPRTTRERWLALVVVILAAVFEECAYRGVAWTLLTRLTGNLWIAALLASIAFSVAHLVQGRTAVLLVVVYALIDHAVVYLTGSLYVAMAAHFLYDAIVMFAVGAFTAPAESLPQVSPDRSA